MLKVVGANDIVATRSTASTLLPKKINTIMNNKYIHQQ